MIRTKLWAADFRGARLDGAILMWNNIDDATRFDANFHPEWPEFLLIGPDRKLRGADMPAEFLYSTDISRADLSAANLKFSCLEKARCVQTNFANADLRFVDATEAILREAKFHWAKLQKSNLRRADLSRAELSSASLRSAVYDEKTVWPTDFDPSTAGCILLGPSESYDGQDLAGVYLSHENLTSASFRDADLRRTTLFGTNLSRANLSGTRLQNARFDSATKWPVEFDPIVAGAIVVPS
jgi:uncharacterized protein YjbI with pentapeptide repeats